MQRLKLLSTPAEIELLSALEDRSPEELLTFQQLVELVATADEESELLSLAQRLATPSPIVTATPAQAAAYVSHKERVNARQKAGSAASRDIGPLPPIKDPERRAKGERDYGFFTKTYFPNAFKFEWSDAHKRAIKKIQIAVLIGGLFALAMPRGSGKTTLAVRALLWAIFYAHHFYGMIIGADEDKATKLLDGIKQELRGNQLLQEDFPEICYPIACLGRVMQSKNGQLLDGIPTAIEWTDNQLVLPTVEGSRTSGAIIESGGILTALRGGQYVSTDGTILRPSIMIPDDPQTRESARSIDQSEQRIELLNGDLLGMAGPGVPLAAIMPCTVICKGDAADTLLDRMKHPDWRGEKTKMIVSWPAQMDLWEEYNDLRERCLQAEDNLDENDPAAVSPIQPATDFYLKNRAAMDAGAEVSWEERKLKHEASALQHAMNLYFRSPLTFWAEYQNEPKSLQDEEEFLDRDAIALKLSGYSRQVIPRSCQWLTSFIDVQSRILFWMVCAWERNFTGYVVDYGVWPKQSKTTFKALSARPTLRERYKGKGLEGALYAGLDDTVNKLMGTVYKRDDGAEMRIVRGLIDSGWQKETVDKFCRESPSAAVLTASRGLMIGPQNKPIHAYERRAGWHIGDEWFVDPTRTVKHDKHFWTTVAMRRLSTPIGDPGCVTLYGRKEERIKHEFLARHLTAEQRHVLEGARRCDIWEPKVGETENHWLDCYVGNCVAASMCGARILGAPTADVGTTRQRTRRKKRKFHSYE